MLAQLRQSEEYDCRWRRFADDYRPEADPALGPCQTPQALALAARLGETQAVAVEAFDRAWSQYLGDSGELSRDQAAYLASHRRRFFELLNAVGELTRTVDRPRVLEFGVSTFSALYRRFYPSLRMFTADRPLPPDHGGFTAERCRQIVGSEAHFGVDLHDEAFAHTSGLSAQPPFDLILFTEVLEHLLVDPVALLAQLLSLLKPQGYLYLTTPNVFSHHRLAMVRRRHNPQAVYPGRKANEDAHCHLREYAMGELLTFVTRAGGRVAAGYFSSCWDPPALVANHLRAHPDQCSNLVVVAQP